VILNCIDWVMIMMMTVVVTTTATMIPAVITVSIII